MSSFASSYIKTSTIAVTRNADVLTYTGGNVASFKTLHAGFSRAVGVSSASEVLALSDGTLNNTVVLQADNATLMRAYGVAGGVTQWNVTASNAYVPGTDSKMSVTFATNDVKADLDGTALTSDTAATMPAVTHFSIGHLTNLFQLNGSVGPVAAWTRNLSQSELGAIDR